MSTKRNDDESSNTNDAAARAAVQRFVTTFVDMSRRERMATMLLHRDRNKRCEAIQTVYKWIEPALRKELEGDTGFPAQLEKRFGAMLGTVIDETGARHVTIAEAAAGADGRFGAIFIADARPIAVLFPEVGPPTLCSSK